MPHFASTFNYGAVISEKHPILPFPMTDSLLHSWSQLPSTAMVGLSLGLIIPVRNNVRALALAFILNLRWTTSRSLLFSRFPIPVHTVAVATLVRPLDRTCHLAFFCNKNANWHIKSTDYSRSNENAYIQKLPLNNRHNSDYPLELPSRDYSSACGC